MAKNTIEGRFQVFLGEPFTHPVVIVNIPWMFGEVLKKFEEFFGPQTILVVADVLSGLLQVPW